MHDSLSASIACAGARYYHNQADVQPGHFKDFRPALRVVPCRNASIPLVSYETVRPWAVAIKEQVLSRAMPPWGAAKGFGDLSPDGALSQEEILIISAWVVGGAPEGDPATLPKNEIAMPSAALGSFAAAVQVSTKPLWSSRFGSQACGRKATWLPPASRRNCRMAASNRWSGSIATMPARSARSGSVRRFYCPRDGDRVNRTSSIFCSKRPVIAKSRER